MFVFCIQTERQCTKPLHQKIKIALLDLIYTPSPSAQKYRRQQSRMLYVIVLIPFLPLPNLQRGVTSNKTCWQGIIRPCILADLEEDSTDSKASFSRSPVSAFSLLATRIMKQPRSDWTAKKGRLRPLLKGRSIMSRLDI